MLIPVGIVSEKKYYVTFIRYQSISVEAGYALKRSSWVKVIGFKI